MNQSEGAATTAMLASQKAGETNVRARPARAPEQSESDARPRKEGDDPAVVAREDGCDQRSGDAELQAAGRLCI